MILPKDYLDIFTNLLKAKALRGFNFAPAPRVIAYTVTWRCNAGCEMCGIKDVDNSLKDKKKELSAKDISRIFADRFLRKLDLIRFTGGEPFLKEDFTDIVEEIIKNTQTKIYYITTNGFFKNRIFDFVERLAPKTKDLVIQVSLDAVGETHDKIRKLPGLYDKAVETLRELEKLNRSYSFSFGINQTVTPETVKHIEGISRLSSKLGCDHKLYMAYGAHESKILEGERLGYKLELASNSQKDVTRMLYERIEEYYKNKKKENKSFLSPKILWDVIEESVLLGGKNRLLKGHAFPNPECLAMFFYLRLLPDGTVMPCTLKPKSMGNLKKHSFTEIWNSKLAQDMRNEVRKCKGCWVECDIVPNIAYSFNMAKGMARELYNRLVKR